jgi:hypothetical protein
MSDVFHNRSHVPTLGHVKEPSSCGSLRAAGKILMFSFLPSLIDVSRAAWCGVPLEMKEGTIPIWRTKGLFTRHYPNNSFIHNRCCRVAGSRFFLDKMKRKTIIKLTNSMQESPFLRKLTVLLQVKIFLAR